MDTVRPDANLKSDLLALTERLPSLKVVVFGDPVLDVYWWGVASRISREAPIPVVELRDHTWLPGGAANAAHNVLDLGGQVRLFGMLGEDSEGEALREVLVRMGVDVSGLLAVPGRGTTTKTRVMAQNQQVARIDRLAQGPGGEVLEKVVAGVLDSLEWADCVVLSDYGEGNVVADTVVPVVTRARELGRPIAADPRPADIRIFGGCTFISPNAVEVAAATGIACRDERELEQAARRLLTEVPVDFLLITRGSAGSVLCFPDQSPVRVPAVTVEVYDTTGAGDTTVACATMALAAGATPLQGAVLASYASAVTVAKIGAATATPREVARLIEERMED